MRILTVALLIVLLLAQGKLWFGKQGYLEYKELIVQYEQQVVMNEHLKQNNHILREDIRDLKEGQDAVEEMARNELGMIAPNETFYRIVPVEKKDHP